MKNHNNLSDKEFLKLLQQSKEEVKIPQTFENKLNTLIDNLEKQRATRHFSWKKTAIWTVSIAASLTLIFSVGFYLTNNSQKQQYAENQQISIENLSVADREKVIEAHRALVLVSQNYNKSLNSMKKAENQILQLQSIVNKSFNK